ncbi:Sel1 repeat protein [Ancylostoma caninum]|uniref:Sel1 repeat protein n=1 Tax=Ancylostoma caninum TaxID=29170 RepID=A0A368FLZ7_ANCCA|nr:Sel1 repeat protein [Ancylostoma caninum]
MAAAVGSGDRVGLGQLYLRDGRGVEQNFELANKYFSSAAEAGHAGAFAFLGKRYLDGTPQDNTTAFNFSLRSADKFYTLVVTGVRSQGNQNGQAGLGVMYRHGRGVRRDYEEAYRFFSLAAEQGWRVSV